MVIAVHTPVPLSAIRLKFGEGYRLTLPPSITTVRIHGGVGTPPATHVGVGIAICGDPTAPAACTITMDGPSERWAVNLPPRSQAAVWRSGLPPDSRVAYGYRHSEISARDHWSRSVAAGDWVLEIGRQAFGIHLPVVPALPPIWCDGTQPVIARWQFLRRLCERGEPLDPPVAQRLDPQQHSIARWIYTAVLRDLLARHLALRPNPQETYTDRSHYRYLLLYHPGHTPAFRFEFLECALKVDHGSAITPIQDTTEGAAGRAREARRLFPHHQLVSLTVDIGSGTCYVAAAGTRWWSHPPCYADFDFLHELTVPELERLILLRSS